MSSRGRLILGIVLGSLFVATTSVVAYTAASFHLTGTIAVEVMERDGNHISLKLPAAVVPVVLSLVPDRCLREAAREMQPWWPAARAAVQEIVNLPETTFVEVEGEDEHVRIGIRDGHFFVMVDSEDETVHISFPTGILKSILKKLEGVDPDLQTAHPWKLHSSYHNDPSI